MNQIQKMYSTNLKLIKLIKRQSLIQCLICNLEEELKILKIMLNNTKDQKTYIKPKLQKLTKDKILFNQR